jgi:ribose transport system permease protein
VPADRHTAVSEAVAPPAAELSITEQARARQRRLFQVPESAALLLVLAGLVLFFSLKSEFFFNTDNFTNILTSIAVVGIVSVPLTMLLIAGQFDLSVGSGVAFVTVIFAYETVTQGHGTVRGVFVALLVGLVIGVINGSLVTIVGVNALITTLGTLAMIRGLAFVRSDGQSIGIEGFSGLALSRPLFNIPWSVWVFFGIVLLGIFTMRYTTFGRSLYAIGSNPVAARLAGVRVGRIIFFAFVLSGLCIAIAGLVLASETGQGSPINATGLELSAVTAVILGGASLAGGRGTITGTVLAIVVIGVINNGLVLMNVISFWQDVIRGALLIGAVAFDQLRLRLTKAG